MRRDLVVNAAHELRTPVTALRATLENVVDGVAPVEPAALRAQTERLQLLVAQLLDLSRLESGALGLARSTVLVAGVMKDAVAAARLTAPAVRFGVDGRPAGLTVSADPAQLAQVLANLLGNAVQHAPAGGCVRVEAVLAEAELRLAVADAGPGIPAAERERVFERFHRVDAARARAVPEAGGGAGLGLAIVRGLVELHGGRVHAEVARPHGCRIVVALPGATA